MKPILTIIVVAVLYSGCYVGNGRKYLLRAPRAVAYDITDSQRKDVSIPAQNLVIEVTVPLASDVAGIMSLPGNMAYAYSSHILIDKIEDIRIRTVNGYNSYAALDDISAICDFQYADGALPVGKPTIIQKINKGYSQSYHVFTIKLNELPATVKEHSFIVELITDKSARLADTTKAITLTP